MGPRVNRNSLGRCNTVYEWKTVSASIFMLLSTCNFTVCMLNDVSTLFLVEIFASQCVDSSLPELHNYIC